MEDSKTKPGVDFATLTLNVQTFPVLYRQLQHMRFPLPVAQVLELRYLLNHATDGFREPPRTPDYRQFLEALGNAIDSFGVESTHHRRRLLKLLTLLRELHVNHSLASRDAEVYLRDQLARNRERHGRSVRFAVLWAVATVAAVAAWALLPTPDVTLKFAAAVFAWFSLRRVRRLPRLDAEHQTLRQQLNELLRQRVGAMNWKMLIHKLALILGFKQVRGVEVFRHETDGEQPRRRRRPH